MSQENARRTRRAKHESIRSHNVTVELAAVAVCIVVVDEGYGILRVSEMNHTGRLVISSVCLPYEFCHIVCRKCLVDLIFEREVERSRLLARRINPSFHSVKAAVPIFADTILWLAVFIIHFSILSCITFHHVITESYVA